MQKEIEKLRTLGRIDLFRPELVNTLQDTRVYLTYLAYLLHHEIRFRLHADNRA